ncbi:prepilin-type N-terminal cleavage/methylation domain-containing protein [Serpentinicella sp. ANB-PHB4]|uniref:PilW family protein n=1 Tax=Serpentinicella sp. ANB-PHB4 TaxID=3074076 RepID=UPI0028549E82|nr:prepilin-type N-terminal cleavage/methylation domain-containing protein [Serpentinicella sp. ANB-PHB4]MDR5658119.1 prepilin-type N-terminal cleavage/methylation domain-containing protein [Serpentinicella sp. ANB-PHB4]
MYKKIIKNNKGITLVELIVAMAIVSIIGGLTISMFSFGITAFSRSDQQYQIQSDLRFATQFITREVRNAGSVDLQGNIQDFEQDFEQSLEQGYNYIYYKNGELKYKASTGEKHSLLKNVQIDDQEIFSSSDNLLKIELNGNKNNESFSLTTKVALTNAKLDTENKGNVIKFSK